MLDMESSVNFIVNNMVSRRLLSFDKSSSNHMFLIEKDVTVAINSLEGQQTMKTDIVGFSLTRPDNSPIKAFVVERIHSFPRFHLPTEVILQYTLDGPYPRPRGEVDLLLGVVDTFKLLIGRHAVL